MPNLQSRQSRVERKALLIADEALRKIADETCMVIHDSDGSWIDTGVPAAIAAEALRHIEEALRA